MNRGPRLRGPDLFMTSLDRKSACVDYGCLATTIPVERAVRNEIWACVSPIPLVLLRAKDKVALGDAQKRLLWAN